MKTKTLTLGSIFIFVLYIFFPYVFITLNSYFTFPVIHYPLLDIIGLILIPAGAFPMLYSLFVFKAFGQGTPVPTEATKKLVTKGFYQHIRNPIYVGHMIAFLGVFLLYGHVLLLLYPLLAFIFFNIFLVLYEEPDLRKRLGQAYIDYCKTVPRWGIKI